MYNSEELFVDKFIACLKKMGVARIPFDNEDFYNGVQSMRQYFNDHRANMGEYQNELAMLFIKKPMEDIYPEFKNVLSKQNGWYISFENPGYVVATIKLNSNGAAYILDQNDLDIPWEYLFGIVQSFLAGAGLLSIPEHYLT